MRGKTKTKKKLFLRVRIALPHQAQMRCHEAKYVLIYTGSNKAPITLYNVALAEILVVYQYAGALKQYFPTDD